MSQAVQKFQNIVDGHCNSLRKLIFHDLKHFPEPPTEFITVGKRKGKISIIVNHLPSDDILSGRAGLFETTIFPDDLESSVGWAL
jgi:hypothetical protein